MTPMPSCTMQAAGVPIRPFGGTTHGLPALHIRRVREALDRRPGDIRHVTPEATRHDGFPEESEKFCTLACPTPGSEGTPGAAGVAG